MASRIERRCAAGHEWIDNVPGRPCPYCSTGSTGATRSTRATSPTSSTGSTGSTEIELSRFTAADLPELDVSEHECPACSAALVWTRARTALLCRTCPARYLPSHVHERQSARTAPATRERDPMAEERAALALADYTARLRWGLTQLAHEVGEPGDAINAADAAQLAGWHGRINELRSRPISSQAELQRIRELADELANAIRSRNPQIPRARYEVEHQGNGHQAVIEGELIESQRELTTRESVDERRARQWAELERYGVCELCNFIQKLTLRPIARYEIRAHRPAYVGRMPDPIRVCESHLFAGERHMNDRASGFGIHTIDLRAEVSA